MNISLLQFTIVVIGDKHNPTIVDRHFLQLQKIVPKTWLSEVDDDKVITTPMLARVPYKNGVLIQVEPQRAQFCDASTRDPGKSEIARVAGDFVTVLRHVHYKSVGINFNCLIEMPAPESYLIKRFLKAGDWQTQENELNSIGLRMIYGINDGFLTISMDAGVAVRRDDPQGQERPVMFLNANIHRDCQDYPAAEIIKKHLESVASDWIMFQKLAGKLLDGSQVRHEVDK